MLKLMKNSRQVIKPIFSTPSYLESVLAYCDLCFDLIDYDKDISFECRLCSDFNSCSRCIKQKARHLISHPSDHHFFPAKPPNTYWIHRNLTITCARCGEKHFFGKHYQCRQCCDYNVCSKCLSEAQDNHYPSQGHSLVYIPNPTKIHHNRFLLADRASRILRYRNADPSYQDEITGWTLAETKIIHEDEWNYYCAATKEALQIIEDNDLHYTSSIIENEKKPLFLILIGNN